MKKGTPCEFWIHETETCDGWMTDVERTPSAHKKKALCSDYFFHVIEKSAFYDAVREANFAAVENSELRIRQIKLIKTIETAYKYMKGFSCEINCDPSVGFHEPECCIKRDFEKVLKTVGAL